MKRLTGEELRLLWGFCLLLLLAVLAAVIALGKVEASTSYGLLPVLTALSTLAGSFANWAFGESRSLIHKEDTKQDNNGIGE